MSKRFNVPEQEMALRILSAAEVLMARVGVSNLSTHKIAKEAGVSVGTIYLHFKDKDDLLNQLVPYLFGRFHKHSLQFYDPTLPLFEQYQQFWRGKYAFLKENPTIVLNMYQYEALPNFRTLLQQCMVSEDLPWNLFVKQGQEEGVLAKLPSNVLFSLSMNVGWDLAYHQLINPNVSYDEPMLEEIILRTWKAITL